MSPESVQAGPGHAAGGQTGPRENETVADVGEFALIRRMTAGRAQPDSTLLGPGDDAAVLTASGGSVVAATDVLVENVHFRLDWSAPEQVGRKAVAVNLADVAAMGAEPTGLLVGLACPSTTSAAVIDDLSGGLWAEAEVVGAGVIGGDVVNANVLTVSVTALGTMRERPVITRAGARPGDVLAVAGRLGWAAAGLAVLGRGFRSPRAVVGAHRVPEPPYGAGPQAAEAGATAMIDVSDGLLADLGHLAEASGVAVDVHRDELEVPHRLAEVASALGADAQHWVLTGGEDHALVATFPPSAALPEGWRAIGSVAEGAGVTVDRAAYEGASGWQHWR